jgi:hypothetical protein
MDTNTCPYLSAKSRRHHKERQLRAAWERGDVTAAGPLLRMVADCQAAEDAAVPAHTRSLAVKVRAVAAELDDREMAGCDVFLNAHAFMAGLEFVAGEREYRAGRVAEAADRFTEAARVAQGARQADRLLTAIRSIGAAFERSAA